MVIFLTAGARGEEEVVVLGGWSPPCLRTCVDNTLWLSPQTFHRPRHAHSYPHTKNLLGNGVVVDFEALFSELEPMERQGVDWKGRLFISDRAHIVFPFHRTIDGMLEQSLAATGSSIGTTKRVRVCGCASLLACVCVRACACACA
jgi:hypothetical protein